MLYGSNAGAAIASFRSLQALHVLKRNEKRGAKFQSTLTPEFTSMSGVSRFIVALLALHDGVGRSLRVCIARLRPYRRPNLEAATGGEIDTGYTAWAVL